MEEVALETWEMENNIVTITDDAFFGYDDSEQRKIKPWEKDPGYFKHVKVSAPALLKMIIHTRFGGETEVMGLLKGKVVGESIVVLDVLPTEFSSVHNPHILEGRLQENVVGWYHSHPGIGCWQSSIDVSTQLHNQKIQEPFLVVVIDPIRTASAGKVDIAAFRTYEGAYFKDHVDHEFASYDTMLLTFLFSNLVIF